MTVLITLVTGGVDTGPFNLYSDVDGFTSAFETGISKTALELGYSSSLVPDYTTTIRVMSIGICSNYSDFPISTTTTTTTALTCSFFVLQAGKVKETTANYTDCSDTSKTTSYVLTGGQGKAVCAVSNPGYYPYFTNPGEGIVTDTGKPCGGGLTDCITYTLDAGALDTTYRYLPCNTSLTVEVTITAGNSSSVCGNDSFGVQIVDGDGTYTGTTTCS